MAEFIEREKVYHKLTGVCDGYCHAKMCKFTEYMLEEIEDIPTADVQPVRKWVNDKILSPSVDGDYLVLYRGYFNVFERFKGKWFDEKGVEVDTEDLLWWQELPPMPEPIKG